MILEKGRKAGSRMQVEGRREAERVITGTARAEGSKQQDSLGIGEVKRKEKKGGNQTTEARHELCSFWGLGSYPALTLAQSCMTEWKGEGCLQGRKCWESEWFPSSGRRVPPPRCTCQTKRWISLHVPTSDPLPYTFLVVTSPAGKDMALAVPWLPFLSPTGGLGGCW